MIVDYFLRYLEVHKLTTTTSQSIINSLKTVFARHGISETLRTDNGPQFSSQQFAEFAKQYDFTHTSSSPHFPASNGQAERTVQTVKHLLKDTDDPPLTLLSYRATPFPWCGRSPAELLMGRNIRTTLPQTTTSLISQWSYLTEFKQLTKSLKINRRRISMIVTVFVTCQTFQTTLMFGSLLMDRISLAGLLGGQKNLDLTLFKHQQEKYAENRSQLNINPSTTTNTQPITNSRSPVMTRSRTGTAINPPDRLVYN